ncbi:hypothetical protein C0991_002727 [Blastosporella zonata]|nr:hypothetical protein C0991_002727 [Blastosporella zonata]
MEGEQTSIDALSQFHLKRLIFARDPETWKKIDIIATAPLVREALAIRKAMLSLKDTLAAENMETMEKISWLSCVFLGGRFLTQDSPTGIGINWTALKVIPDLLRETAPGY